MITRMSCSISSSRSRVVGQLGDHRDQLVGLGLVEARGRLVEEQVARPHRDHPRDLQPALLAVGRSSARDSASEAIPTASSASRARAAASRRRSPIPTPPTSAFSSTVRSPNEREPWNVRTIPQVRAALGRQPGDVLAVDDHRPAGRSRWKPLSTLTSVVLPAPFGPISPRISLRPQVEVDVVDRLDALEVDGDRLGDQRPGRGATGRRADLIGPCPGRLRVRRSIVLRRLQPVLKRPAESGRPSASTPRGSWSCRRRSASARATASG